MEVHPQLHRAHKRGTHYFWEFLLLFLLFASDLKAQDRPLLQDRENLLTVTERAQIDSLLQAYRKRSVNLVAVYTDSADISVNEFGLSVQEQYGQPKTDRHYNFILLMSRKYGLVFASVNQSTTPFVSEQLLTGILEKGVPALKEKRVADAIRAICTAAMVFLDQLPVNNK